ncbi:GNAT family N-acetyltransferase [Anaerolineales bacterium]
MFIRAARPEEANQLSELALASKAYWDYTPEFIAACRDDLTLTPADLTTTYTVYLAEAEDRLLGFYALGPVEQGGAEIAYFFISPDAIGQGIGRLLFQHLQAQARQQDYTFLQTDSDPNAQAFYEAMGMICLGQVESTVSKGRFLPLMHMELD